VVSALSFWWAGLAASGAIAQAGTRPPADSIIVDTLAPPGLLGDATVVRTESVHGCADCGSSYVTDIVSAAARLHISRIEDLAALWRTLPPLSIAAPPDALRERLISLMQLTYLPDAEPMVVRGAEDLRLWRALVPPESLSTPIDAVDSDGRRTTFLVTTQHALYRVQAEVNPYNQLTIASREVSCYVCP
jgi:hypothetical protein